VDRLNQCTIDQIFGLDSRWMCVPFSAARNIGRCCTSALFCSFRFSGPSVHDTLTRGKQQWRVSERFKRRDLIGQSGIRHLLPVPLDHLDVTCSGVLGRRAPLSSARHVANPFMIWRFLSFFSRIPIF
jgi:hypothetical protein